jgi:hypothetical protein
MIELKTLENFQREAKEIYDDAIVGGTSHPVIEEIFLNLRAEAIKWIKADEKLEDACDTSDTFGTIHWIKHFFNITDEELK